MSKLTDRFVRTYKQGSEFSTRTEVWVDRVTGVNYLFLKSGYGAGVTPLLDREGKPVVTPIQQPGNP